MRNFYDLSTFRFWKVHSRPDVVDRAFSAPPPGLVLTEIHTNRDSYNGWWLGKFSYRNYYCKQGGDYLRTHSLAQSMCKL